MAGAIDDNSQAIALAPDYAEAYLNRAAARERTGDLAGAIADLEQAKQVGSAELQPQIDETLRLLHQRLAITHKPSAKP